MTTASDRNAWIEPGAYEVAPDVFRIPLPLPSDALRAVNVYAVRNTDSVVLIDAGWALETSEAQLARSLDVIGYGLDDIDLFLITHAHRDHYTQASTLRRRFGGRVLLGAAERISFEHIVELGRGQEPRQWRLLETCGADHLARTLRAEGQEIADPEQWEAPDEWLADRTRITLAGRTLEAIHTPGHTRGHLIYRDTAADVVFAGDHVLPHITPSIGYEIRPSSSPLADYLTSLRLLREMPDARLLAAHGPVMLSVHKRVDELIAHHDARLLASLTALEAGDDTAYQVAARLPWTRRASRFDSLDPLNQMFAVLETRAHLEVLRERRMVIAEVVEGVTHYSEHSVSLGTPEGHQ